MYDPRGSRLNSTLSHRGTFGNSVGATLVLLLQAGAAVAVMSTASASADATAAVFASSSFLELKQDLRSSVAARMKAGAIRQFVIANNILLVDVVQALLGEGLLDAKTIELLYAPSRASSVAAPAASAKRAADRKSQNVKANAKANFFRVYQQQQQQQHSSASAHYQDAMSSALVKKCGSQRVLVVAANEQSIGKRWIVGMVGYGQAARMSWPRGGHGDLGHAGHALGAYSQAELVPCDLGRQEGCDEHVRECAGSSWFVPHVFPGASDSMMRALAVALANGHPCTTKRMDYTQVGAVVLVLPYFGLPFFADNRSHPTPWPFGGHGNVEAQATLVDLARRWRVAAARVQQNRRFIVASGPCFADKLQMPERLEMRSHVPCLHSTWNSPYLIPTFGATLIQRGVQSDLRRKRRAKTAGMSRIVGWPIGIDTPFSPGSHRCLAGWQQLLRVTPRILLVASNAGRAGGLPLAWCLRRALQVACTAGGFPACASHAPRRHRDNATHSLLKSASRKGASLKSLPLPTSLEALSDHYRHFMDSSFFMAPAGDENDRTAMSQALDAGCIPVFFEGTSEGSETRAAMSRTLFGTDHADSWSVLLRGPRTGKRKATEHSHPLLTEAMFEKASNNCTSAPPGTERRLWLEIETTLSEIPKARVTSMREFIINGLPGRSSHWTSLRRTSMTRSWLDQSDRIVLAMLAANEKASTAPAGSPLSWPRGV